MQWHQLDNSKQSMPRYRQITTSTPYHLIFTGRMLFLTPNQQCQSTEGTFQINTWKQFYQTALGNSHGLKLPKCWLQFKKKKYCVVVIIFGTLSFPNTDYIIVPAVKRVSVCFYRMRALSKKSNTSNWPTASAAKTGDKRMDEITPPATARLRLCFVIDRHRLYSCK